MGMKKCGYIVAFIISLCQSLSVYCLIDSSIITDIVSPLKGSVWTPKVRVILNVELGEEGTGEAGDLVRGAPFSYIVCYSSGDITPEESLQSDNRPVCKPLVGEYSEDGIRTLLSDVTLKPLSESGGYGVVKAWIQSKFDTPAHISYAVGRSAFTYLWNDPLDAIDGLKERFSSPLIGEAEKLSVSNHLAIAHIQQSSIYMHLAASHGAQHQDIVETQSSLERIKDSMVTAVNEAVDSIATRKPLEFDSDTTTSVDSDKLLDPRDPDALKSMLERVAIITVSNSGYVNYTLNAMKSLRIKCNMPCVLQVFCVDEGCATALRQSEEVLTYCPPHVDSSPTIHLLPEHSLVDNEKGDMAGFTLWKRGAFGNLMKCKIIAIYEFLQRYKYVLIADGDIVFLQPDFLPHLLKVGQNMDMAVQCGMAVPVGLNQLCSAVGEFTGSDGTVSVSHFETLCAGFMLIRQTPRTLDLFKPEVVFEDASYMDPFDDQDYLNERLKHKLKYHVLDIKLYPNGAPYKLIDYDDRFVPPPSPYLIHFNFMTGKEKQAYMKERGLWFV